jgi:hypothetical protein
MANREIERLIEQSDLTAAPEEPNRVGEEREPILVQAELADKVENTRRGSGEIASPWVSTHGHGSPIELTKPRSGDIVCA